MIPANSSTFRSTTRARQLHGFTLVELLVVIGIVVVLAAIGIAGLMAIQTSARSKSTQGLLGQLQSVVTEYKVISGGSASAVPTQSGTVEEDFQILILDFKNTGKESSVSKLFKTINASNLPHGVDFDELVMPTSPDPYEHVVDAWGNPVAYFRADGVGMGGTGSGSGPTGNFLQPKHQTSYFASPGPDGLWGRWKIPTGSPAGSKSEPDDDAADNLYSFDAVR